MKITVEFANLNEFKQYMGVESPNLLAQASKETEDAPAPAEAVQEPQKAPEDPVPKVEDGKMEFYRMFSLSELKNGYKKIPEPAGDTDRYLFEPEHADKTLLLMPGSAFDPLGNRMGDRKSVV